MPTHLITRILVRLLARGRGEVRARQDVQHLRGVLRFTMLFAATVILPAIILAYLALGSLGSEEDRFDQELRARADQAANQVFGDLEATFKRFEQATNDRLYRGQSPLTNLAELSPYLRAAFRFDREGHLAAPFTLPEPAPTAQPTARYRRTIAEARRAEAAGEHYKAAALYRRAASAGTEPSLVGEARFAEAGALYAAGLEREAVEAYYDTSSEFIHVRDAHGFLLGDLARLRRAEIAFANDPDAGAVALQTFVVDHLLASDWTIGYPGEAAVARRALQRLEGRVDPDWLGRTRTLVDERNEQLYWATLLQDELELFAGTTLRQNPNEFVYQPRAESNSLWSTLWWGEDLYAFSFHQGEIKDALRRALLRTDALDEDITLHLVPAREQPSEVALAVQPLSPYLPDTMEVGLASVEQLQRKRSRQRWFRVAILTILVGMTAVGVILTAMTVGRELEAARMKADFAANVSHELRSPITQIRIKAEALLLDLVFDDEDRNEHHAAIVRETERLSRLIDNILDFSAIERGAKSYTFRPQDIGEIVRNACEAARSNMRSRGLDLEVDVPDDLPVVWVDREAVSQVVTNLMSNAAKYGADGKWVGVKVRVGIDGVDISVADKGMGIPAPEQAHIFDHFYRSGDPRVRRRRGTGIGLSIVRYIVDAHGGSISVVSSPGEGASFTVTFPLEPPEGIGA